MRNVHAPPISALGAPPHADHVAQHFAIRESEAHRALAMRNTPGYDGLHLRKHQIDSRLGRVQLLRRLCDRERPELHVRHDSLPSSMKVAFDMWALTTRSFVLSRLK